MTEPVPAVQWPPYNTIAARGILDTAGRVPMIQHDYDIARTCVNFCAGYPIADLAGTLAEILEAFERERERLKAEVNNLKSSIEVLRNLR